jgi:hypothetical protein
MTDGKRKMSSQIHDKEYSRSALSRFELLRKGGFKA